MRKYIRIKDEQHSKEVQEKLFKMGYEWSVRGKEVSYTHGTVLVLDETSFIRYGKGDWYLLEGDVEVTVVETIFYEFKEVESVIELNGKKYRKQDLEEALKNLKPLN